MENRKQFNLKNKKPVALRGVAQATSHGLTVNLYADYQTQNTKWATLAEECHIAAELKQFYTKQEKKLKDQLIALSNDEPSHAGNYVLKRVERMGSIQYKDIPAVKVMSAQELNMYRGNTSVAWKLETK